MALVAHFDLELHQMDAKTAFLNGDLSENVYMAQPKGFVIEGKEKLGCRLMRSIYSLKQASRQWYIKFDETIRRSQRVQKPVISSDYEVYIVQDMNSEEDPVTFEEAMKSPHSSKWRVAMEDELKSMKENKVWDLEEIPKGAKTVGCKWVYKTKRDSKGKIERYKTRFVAKGFT